MNNLRALEQKYGSVNHKGKTYILDGHAHLSNRVFTGWWGDADEGEEYTAEYKAIGIDKKTGDAVEVYWQFDETKGQEPADESDYPFNDKHVSQIMRQ